MWNWKNMMKRFSTRADKWPYVFALISHIFNFLAESQILFLYHIVDHQKDHLFCWFHRSNQSSNNLLFLLVLVHSYHLSSLLFFKFTFIIFLLLFFSFCFSFLFLSVLLFFFFFFQSRRSSESRLSPPLRDLSDLREIKIFFFLSLLLILSLFLLLFLQNVPRH